MKRRLMIVDDDASVRESLKKVLEDAGYEVVLASDAEEAEVRFDPQEISLLVLDLNLPVRDGWDVLEHVNSCAPLLPVILITGLVDQLATRSIPGASALLEKPVDAAVMLKTIERVLATPVEDRLSEANAYWEEVQSATAEGSANSNVDTASGSFFRIESGASKAARTTVRRKRKAPST